MSLVCDDFEYVSLFSVTFNSLSGDVSVMRLGMTCRK